MFPGIEKPSTKYWTGSYFYFYFCLLIDFGATYQLNS